MDEKLPKPAFRISIMLALLLTALLAALLATWRVRQISADSRPWNASSIQRGMTKKEVGLIMGNHFSETPNVWSYRVGRSVRGDGGPTVEIVFEDGLVIDVRDGYEQPSPRPYVVGP